MQQAQPAGEKTLFDALVQYQYEQERPALREAGIQALARLVLWRCAIPATAAW